MNESMGIASRCYKDAPGPMPRIDGEIEPTCIFGDHRPGIDPKLMAMRAQAWRRDLIRVRAGLLGLGENPDKRACKRCGIDIGGRSPSARRCVDCAAIALRRSNSRSASLKTARTKAGRVCVTCGADISQGHGNRKRCAICVASHRVEHDRERRQACYVSPCALRAREKRMVAG